MQIAYALPIVPGKTDRAKEQTKEYDEHMARYEELNAQGTVARHSVWVQGTPMGDFEITLMEVQDSTKLRTSYESDEYDQWWRGFIKDVHGFDPQDMGADFQPPPQVLGTAKGGAGPERSVAFVVPVLDVADFKKMAEEVGTERAEEHRTMSDSLGLDGEDWFLQENPMGDSAIVYFEGSDLSKTLQSFGEMTGSYEDWFKGRLLATTGIDYNQPAPPPPDLVFDWRA